MLAALLIVAGVGRNFHQHRNGKPTVCWGLRHLPRWLLMTLVGAFVVWFPIHLWRGYPPRS